MNELIRQLESALDTFAIGQQVWWTDASGENRVGIVIARPYYESACNGIRVPLKYPHGDTLTGASPTADRVWSAAEDDRIDFAAIVPFGE